MASGGCEALKCSISGCASGPLAQHNKTKNVYCVAHAVALMRDKTISTWDFTEAGVDVKNPPEGYDCLAIHPRCEKCELPLSEDDLNAWEEALAKDSSAATLCEDCAEED